MDFFQPAYLKRLKANVRLIYRRIACVCRKNVAIEMSYFPLFHEILLILTKKLITRNTVVVDINFKKLSFKNLIKIVLVSTMFIQRAENLAKLIGMRIILTSANWEHNVQ